MTTEDMTGTSTKADHIDASTADSLPFADRDDPARQLLAKARYDAFKVMTETNEEAEVILAKARAEAAGTIRAGEISAEAIIEKAKAKAQSAITSATEEGAAIVAKAHRAAGEETASPDTTELLEEHRNLSDRVSTLRTLANQLEDRFAALASTASGSQSNVKNPKTTVAPTIDYSPSVPQKSLVEEQKPVEEIHDEPVAAESRGSFYNRRSANLPRLGAENQEGIASMTRSLRKSLESD